MVEEHEDDGLTDYNCKRCVLNKENEHLSFTEWEKRGIFDVEHTCALHNK